MKLPIKNLTYFLLFILSVACVQAKATTPVNRAVAGAESQIGVTKFYDPAYVKLDYPGGDVPSDRGVCTDVVVRSFRHAGVDLQKELHQDMKRHFSKYPKNWGLKRPDKNIDHRRVPNLMIFFKRRGKSLTVTKEAKNYLPGDVVVWRLDNGLLHTGLVVHGKSNDDKRPLIIHNIGAGAQREDVLFQYTILGHYRFF